MVKRAWAPGAGDMMWLAFDPQAGREQARRRPAVVLSPSQYNRKSGLALVCPVTSHAKGYPFEVALPPGIAITGVILADHLKSVDWRVRRAEPLGRLPADVLREVLDRLAPLLGF
ncbi:MAG: endoribonuclease MazF [Terriglobia bacterium]